MDLVNNKLTSPNFPKPFDPLTECKWNLIAPHGHYVTLAFEIIDVSDKWFVSCFYLDCAIYKFWNYWCKGYQSGIKMKNGSWEDRPDSNEQKVWFLDFPLMIKSFF